MPPVHGSLAKAYVNGYDLSTYLTELGVEVMQDVAETSTLGTAAKTYIPGLQDATLSGAGIFDAAANAEDPVLAAAFGVNLAASGWIVAPVGDAFGSPAYGFAAHQTKYSPQAQVDDAVKFGVEAQSTTGKERLLILEPLTAITAGGNAASIDNAAASAAGGVAYFQVHAFVGTTLTLKVQSSPDNSVWTDLVTATVVTAGRKYERIAVAGSVPRYLRALWTATVTSASIFVGFGRY